MASLLDQLPPELLEYVKARAPTHDLSGFDAAAAKDRESAGYGAIGQNLSRAAALVRGEQVGEMATPPSDELRTWVLRKQMAHKDSDPLDRLGKVAGIAKDLRPSKESLPNPDNDPAPPEWGALPGMTRGQAISSGYAKRSEQKPEDPMKAPPSETLRAELRKNGKNPDIYPTTGAALSALGPRFMIPEQIIEGDGGQLFRVPTKGPDLTPKPIAAPGGGGGKFIKDKDLPPATGRELADLAAEFRNFEALRSSFKDEYAGMGLTGGVQTGLARGLGAAGTSGQQQLAAWWKDFDRLVNLPQRNEMFGASLTPGEKASWEGAQNISPKSDPKIVKAAFEKLHGIVERKLRGRGEGLIEDGYGASVIGRVSDGIVGGAGPSGGAGVSRADQQAKAWADANPDDPRAAAIRERLKAKGL
jgi:hypothetical protein